jgi:peptide/nickel transport system substrate-binding protein
VNRAETSKDIKYAFERFFSENVGGQYGTYFSSIEGVPEEPTKGVKDISGITTPDDTTIEFKLARRRPRRGRRARDADHHPGARGVREGVRRQEPLHVQQARRRVGPYMVANDAEGVLTGYKAGKSIKLVRNPNWDKATDFKPAYLDEINMKTNGADASVDAQQVLKGQGMMLDTNPPAAELKQAVEQYKDQFEVRSRPVATGTSR